MNWGWSEILWVSLIGFSLVFILLVALIFIMKAFGACFRVRPASGRKVDAQPMISEEEIAAIATALKIYKGALHDRCLLYTSPSPRDGATSRMPSSA